MSGKQVAADLFAAPQSPVSPRTAIRWWEARRLAYTVFVLIAAAVGIVLFFVAIVTSGALDPGEDAVEPLGLIFGLPILVLVMNACFTLGWLVEAPVRVIAPNLSAKLGPSLFGAGLGLTALVLLAPAVYWFAVGLGLVG